MARLSQGLEATLEDRLDEIRDGVVLLERMAELELLINLVAIISALALARDDAVSL